MPGGGSNSRFDNELSMAESRGFPKSRYSFWDRVNFGDDADTPKASEAPAHHFVFCYDDEYF